MDRLKLIALDREDIEIVSAHLQDAVVKAADIRWRPAERRVVVALNRFPAEYDKLRANPALIPSMVSEIIRYQTPVLHMRRTARNDVELAGRGIAKGDKVVMWYISGNRDEEKIEHADQFIVDRAKPRQHLAFGAGVHRCVGDRLAEQQLRILWEEILQRDLRFEIMGPPQRLYSNFIRGIRSLPIRILS